MHADTASWNHLTMCLNEECNKESNQDEDETPGEDDLADEEMAGNGPEEDK
jgi:hypothetical protein